MNLDDASFDQQASSLLEQTKFQQARTPLFQLSDVKPKPTDSFEGIANQISRIEERLNACDSLYRLATQTNIVREKERREKFQSLTAYLKSLDQRITSLEEKVNVVPKLIKKYVTEEMKEYDNSKQTATLLQEAQKRIMDRIEIIEKQFASSMKKSQKDLKRLKIDSQLVQSQPESDDRIEDVAAQIAEMKRRQTLMFDLLNAMRSHNSRDYENVNAQLSTLWAQLSVKRMDSPIKY